MGNLTLWGSTKEFTEIINLEVGRAADATIKGNKGTWDKAGTSIQQGTLYNGVKIDTANGLVVESTLISSTFNATKGIEIKKKSNNETVFSVDTSGNLVIKGSIQMTGGNITWGAGAVAAPPYSQISGGPPADANNTWSQLTKDPKFTGLFYDSLGKLKLVANSITSTEINAGAVTTDKIYANAVTTAKINAEAVTATEIKTGTITAKQIQARSITANEIVSGTITANEIQANAITAIKLNVADIFADNVFVGKIQAVELNASKITTGYLNGDRIQTNTLDARVLKAGTLSFDQARGGTLRLGEDGGGDLVVYNGKDSDGNLIPVGAINKNSAEFPNLSSPNIKGNVVNTNTQDTTYYVDNINGNDNNDGLTRATAFRTVQAAINSLPKYIARNAEVLMIGSADQVENVSIKGFVGGAQLTLRAENKSKILIGSVDVFGCSVFTRVVDFKINSRTPSAIYVDKCVSVVIAGMEINGNGVSNQGINVFNSHAEVIGCAIYNVTNDCIKAALAAHVYVGDCKGGGANAMHGLTCIGAVVTGYGSAPTGRVSNWLKTYGGYLQEGSWWWDSGSAPPPIPPVTEKTVFIDSVSASGWRPNGDPSGWGFAPADAPQGMWMNLGPCKGLWFFGDRLEFLAGKTIIGMWVSVQRNAGGYSAPASATIRTHSYRTRPSTEPWLSEDVFSVDTPPMNSGDRVWVDVTKLGPKLTSTNDRGGFAVYAKGNALTPYMRMDGWMQVKVTYK